MNDPLVSVVVPLFNKQEYVETTLESVVNQSYRNIELIVIDDSSTDSGFFLVQEYLKTHKDRFAEIKLKSRANTGQTGARNDGVLEASGDFVAFLDADDVWHPDKLEKQVQLMQNFSNLDIVFCNYMMLFKSAFSTKAVRFVPLKNKVRDWLLTSGYGGAMESTAIVRRSSLTAHGAFDKELQMCGGLDLAFRLSANERAGCVDEYLCGYRVIPTGWHNNKKDLMDSYEALLKKNHIYGVFEKSMRRNLALHLRLWNVRSEFSRVNVLNFLEEAKKSPKETFIYLSQTLSRVLTAQARGLLHFSTGRLLLKIARIY